MNYMLNIVKLKKNRRLSDVIAHIIIVYTRHKGRPERKVTKAVYDVRIMFLQSWHHWRVENFLTIKISHQASQSVTKCRHKNGYSDGNEAAELYNEGVQKL